MLPSLQPYENEFDDEKEENEESGGGSGALPVVKVDIDAFDKLSKLDKEALVRESKEEKDVFVRLPMEDRLESSTQDAL